MVIPHFLLQGADAAQHVGLGKKLVNQMSRAGIRSKSMALADGGTLRAQQFGNTGKVWIKTPKQKDPDVEERTKEITECGVWSGSTAGGYGTTVDFWDISALPEGTTFDISFEAYNQPDKFVVEYKGSVVLNTGWRGSVWFTNIPPFNVDGIAGPGGGEIYQFFTKANSDVFKVTVYGSGVGTLWNYAMRANCPSS